MKALDKQNIFVGDDSLSKPKQPSDKNEHLSLPPRD